MLHAGAEIYDSLRRYLETKGPQRINPRARAIELVDNAVILRGSILIDKP